MEIVNASERQPYVSPHLPCGWPFSTETIGRLIAGVILASPVIALAAVCVIAILGGGK